MPPSITERFSSGDSEYLDTDGYVHLGLVLRYHGSITYAIQFTREACYFTREGITSIYTSRHKAIIRHFTQEQPR